MPKKSRSTKRKPVKRVRNVEEKFKSREQMRLCFQKEREARKKGEKSSWDCKKWAENTDWSKIPLYKKNSKRRKGIKKVIKMGLYEGPNGGKFYYRNNRKVYVKDY